MAPLKYTREPLGIQGAEWLCSRGGPDPGRFRTWGALFQRSRKARRLVCLLHRPGSEEGQEERAACQGRDLEDAHGASAHVSLVLWPHLAAQKALRPPPP